MILEINEKILIQEVFPYFFRSYWVAVYSWVPGGPWELIHEKNLKSKISCQAPLKRK
jgi:hypothetical protein